MIQLRLLGSARLLARDGGEARNVLAQPRRFALIAWLALHGTVGRETLLGVFWPESDTTRGRSALRNALHFLRRELGADVIESLGDGALRVSPDTVWCDANAFVREIDEGRAERALEMYRGDLLEGFYVDGAPDFERWVQEERARLRRRALGIASELAKEAAESGQIPLALHHARRALRIEPDDEASLRLLVALQWENGDRTGAIRSYERFAERIEERYGLEPAAETVILLRELRDL
ncbi:MAG: BTAD domain-containing putative transcriptional regulator [Gemmatimonadota bacterium]|nr:BTAD domain-containing putative transcriptional regulator [Gemmatimonadota bacterium]